MDRAFESGRNPMDAPEIAEIGKEHRQEMSQGADAANRALLQEQELVDQQAETAQQIDAIVYGHDAEDGQAAAREMMQDPAELEAMKRESAEYAAAEAAKQEANT